MRKVKFERAYTINSPGSVLTSFGNTVVLCTCTIEESKPPFIEEGGWVTAEYSMLPGSVSNGRKKRETGKRDGRSVEIQRLIGRSLRAAVNMEKLPEVTLYIDCDVLQADGGTRTASISGGWVALVDALKILAEREKKDIKEWLKGQVAAVSVGIVNGEIICDLDYKADSQAEVDMNVVALDDNYVEIQGTGENGVFTRNQLDLLLESADEGLAEIKIRQKEILNDISFQ